MSQKKLTIISIGHRGQSKALLTELPVDEKGRAHMPAEKLTEVLRILGIPEGHTITIGG